MSPAWKSDTRNTVKQFVFLTPSSHWNQQSLRNLKLLKETLQQVLSIISLLILLYFQVIDLSLYCQNVKNCKYSSQASIYFSVCLFCCTAEHKIWSWVKYLCWMILPAILLGMFQKSASAHWGTAMTSTPLESSNLPTMWMTWSSFLYYSFAMCLWINYSKT